MDNKGSPSLSLLQKIDEICDRFEAAWIAGRRPRIEDFLKNAPAINRETLLRSLLRVELELRHRAGKKVAQTEYLQRFPKDKAVIAELIPKNGRNRKTGDGRHRSNSERAIPSPKSTSKIVVQILTGVDKGLRHVLDGYQALVVGRGRGAQLRIRGDRRVSRHHFRIEADPPFCQLLDLASHNGTIVNGRKVSECFLAHGDIVRAGNTELRIFGAKPKPAAARPVPRRLSAAGKVRSRGPTLPGVPGYELDRILGNGPTGAVYRARNRTSGKLCALKVLTPNPDAGDRAVQLFLREVNLLSQLHHPHIVQMSDFGKAGDIVFIEMEYVRRIRLEQALLRLPSARRVGLACGIMCQVLDALEFAHDSWIVHRDIKPSNVLVARTNGKLIGKLADFGLAKSFLNAGLSGITGEGAILGSLPYMSPEQLMDSRLAQPACDIYSAGATLYYLLSGSTPHDLESHSCKFLCILESEPIPLEKRAPGVHPDLAAIVMRALSRSPSQRFPSATAMRKALGPFASALSEIS